MYVEVGLQAPQKQQKPEPSKKFLQNFILSKDGPAKHTESRQSWKHARGLSYFRTMAENKDKKTTLYSYSAYAADVE